MFKKIAVPIDLAHVDKQQKAIAIAADMAKPYAAEVVLVGVTTTAPSSVAHDPDEYAQKIADLAAEQSQALGVTLTSKTVTSVDISIDLEKQLDRVVHEIGADLVVMAPHVPALHDFLFKSHTKYFASHTDLSVLIVR